MGKSRAELGEPGEFASSIPHSPFPIPAPSHIVLVQFIAEPLVGAPALARAVALGRIGGDDFEHALVAAERAFVAQVDGQRAIAGIDAGRHDQHGGDRIVVVAGDLVRNEGLFIEFPQARVDRFGLKDDNIPGKPAAMITDLSELAGLV